MLSNKWLGIYQGAIINRPLSLTGTKPRVGGTIATNPQTKKGGN